MGVNTTYYYPGAVWDKSQTKAVQMVYDYSSYYQVNNLIVDPILYGQNQGFPRRCCSGNWFGAGDMCGSRSLLADSTGIRTGDAFAGRGCKKNVPFTNYPGAQYHEPNKYWSWGPGVNTFVYNSAIDPIVYGMNNGWIRKQLMGGPCDGSSVCGSRSGLMNCSPAYSDYAVSTRGCNTATNYPGAYYEPTTDPNTVYMLRGYVPNSWEVPVYNTSVDSEYYGSTNGFPRHPVCGGSIYDSSNVPGSRSIHSQATGSLMADNISARGCNTARVSWGGYY